MRSWISRRVVVRIITFSIAIISVLSVMTYMSAKLAKDTMLKLQYTYLRAIDEIATCTDNINTTLSKGIYSGTPEMLAQFSSKLWKDSSTAKAYLAQIPISDIQTDKINRFLSQVGNYSVSISKKATEGNVLSEEDYNNLTALNNFASELSDEMWQIEEKAQSGQICFFKTKAAVKSENTEEPQDITEGFESFEEGGDNYPTLIYDGPFSDHILEREPLLIKGMENVDVKTALEKASKCSDVPADKLENKDDEEGKMPSYCFETDGVNISITKAGGLISYMLKSRAVNDKKISVEDALKASEKYMQNLGIENMATTYYETYNNICTINFASEINDVTIYTDLIKVSVALDNAEILGFDARGYIVNHHEREFKKPTISVEDAQKRISPLLTVGNNKLALIPTEGLNEKLTYEFLCTSQEGTKVLVYINTENGIEEQILMIQETKDGILTI